MKILSIDEIYVPRVQIDTLISWPIGAADGHAEICRMANELLLVSKVIMFVGLWIVKVKICLLTKYVCRWAK